MNNTGTTVESIPCRICGDKTYMLGTKLCDRCWELDTRIRTNLVIAEKIFNYYKNKKA